MTTHAMIAMYAEARKPVESEEPCEENLCLKCKWRIRKVAKYPMYWL